MLAMMFSQLSHRESLRNLIVAFEAHHAKSTTENDVRIQISVAIITYPCSYHPTDIQLKHSTYEVLQILSISH